MKIRKLLGYGLVAAVVLANMGLANTVRAASNLRVYDWAGYDNPAFYKPYMDKYQKKPGFSIFAEEEEARAKMKAGFKVDLVHPCSYNANRWRNEGLIQPIDASKLKNYKNLNAKYRNLPGFTVDGKVYIIPYDIGQTALTYNADKVPASDVTTLQAFVNPKYKG
ncbi:MAG: extracellular solute-binding protein, partial [Alphaproteobacteria bacterium]|nr:extracellular solute-binding protein [Alphaproteobacteria bacterium]